MKVLRAAAYRAMPWKNGGGVTHEILAEPAGAEWDLRLSIASVAADGPFSEFPGIDRTLTVLDGAGIVLRIGERENRLAPGVPFAFPGDVACMGELIDGKITDFNVMTRRARFRHSVVRQPAGARLAAPAGAVFAAALVLDPWDTFGRHDLIVPGPGEEVTTGGAVLWLSCAPIPA